MKKKERNVPVMFFTAKEKNFELRQNLKGGEGNTVLEGFKPAQGLPTHYRMYAEMVLNPGCSVGEHTHNGESEIYYVLEGSGELNDNGVIRTINKGDCAMCYDGEFHAIKNNTGQVLRILATIVTNK